jgi:hypothetical protein
MNLSESEQRRRQREARAHAINNRSPLSSIGTAENQSISREVVDMAQEEVGRLSKALAEAQAHIEALEKRLGNQAVTIKSHAATIARLMEEEKTSA